MKCNFIGCKPEQDICERVMYATCKTTPNNASSKNANKQKINIGQNLVNMYYCKGLNLQSTKVLINFVLVTRRSKFTSSLYNTKYTQ